LHSNQLKGKNQGREGKTKGSRLSGVAKSSSLRKIGELLGKAKGRAKKKIHTLKPAKRPGKSSKDGQTKELTKKQSKSNYLHGKGSTNQRGLKEN